MRAPFVIIRSSTMHNYGVKIPPVDMVNVVVPDVPTVPGVAMIVYPVEPMVQV